MSEGPTAGEVRRRHPASGPGEVLVLGTVFKRGAERVRYRWVSGPHKGKRDQDGWCVGPFLRNFPEVVRKEELP